MADQLGRLLFSADDIILDEFAESHPVRPVLEQEVQALAMLLILHTDAFVIRSMLQDQLLQEQEGTFVGDFLTDLDLRLPEMRRVCLLAFVALKILDKKFDNHVLLKDGAAEHFL